VSLFSPPSTPGSAPSGFGQTGAVPPPPPPAPAGAELPQGSAHQSGGYHSIGHHDDAADSFASPGLAPAQAGRVGNVVVVESDSRLAQQLAASIEPGTVTFASVEDLEDGLQPGHGIIAVLGPSYADPISLTAVERLAKLRPEVATLLLVELLSTEVLQRALRAGVKDVLTAPVDSDQLRAAIDRIGTIQNPAPLAPAAFVESEGHGRVVTVFSTKGGAGKSVIASNLAVAIAARTDQPVVLVDADLQFGDVAVMLKLAPKHTIVDAVNAIDRLDGQLLQQLLVRHEPSGVWVLPAPLEPAFADQIGSAQIQRIIELLREFAGVVVVDTPAYFNDVVLGLIEQCDDVLLIAGMDIPNIKNVKIGLQTLRLLNIPLSKLKLVLNRANSKVKLDVGEVEKTLGIKADCLVPSDIAVPQSVNKGVPVVIDSPRSGVARSIEYLASVLVGGQAKKKRSFPL
jgi:pilus assembly protein CpaE